MKKITMKDYQSTDLDIGIRADSIKYADLITDARRRVEKRTGKTQILIDDIYNCDGRVYIRFVTGRDMLCWDVEDDEIYYILDTAQLIKDYLFF